MRVHALLLRDRRQLRARLLGQLALRVLLLFAPLRVRARPLAAGELLLNLHISINLLKLLAERLGLNQKPVALQFHQHLLLDDHLILLTQFQVLSKIIPKLDFIKFKKRLLKRNKFFSKKLKIFLNR